MSNNKPIVVIDPGHGGTEKIGGSSPNNATGPNGLVEKNLTLDIAQRLERALVNDAEVMLTRTGDTNLSLSDRARVACENHAAIFLSIHFNGFQDPTVDGSEVWVAEQAGQRSRDFARAVLDQILTVTAVRERGVRQGNLGVLKPENHDPSTAACLAEISVLSNPAQAQRLESEDYRQRIAAAVAEAVRQRLPVAVGQGMPVYVLQGEGGGWSESLGTSLSNSARLEWVELNRVTGGDGRPHLYYLTSGDPDRGRATFKLKVTNANSVKNFQNVILKIRLASRRADGKTYRTIPLEKPDGNLQEGDYLTLHNRDIEDDSFSIISLVINNSTLLRAYHPDEPVKRLEVEFHWSEEDVIGWSHYYNRTTLAFYLFHPVEFLFDRASRPDGEVRYTDRTHKDKYWLAVGEKIFTDTDRSPVTINLSIQTSLSRTDSSQISITTTKQETTSTGGSVGGSSKTEANLGVEDVVKAGVSAEETSSWSLTWNQSVAREFATNIVKSRSYSSSWTSSKTETVTIEAAPAGNIRTLYTYPIFKRTRTKVVYFGQANALGQGQNRRQVENFPVLQLSHWGYISQDTPVSTSRAMGSEAAGPVFVLGRSVGDGGHNDSADVLALKDRLISLGFNWLTRNNQMDAACIRGIRLFQSIIAGRNNVSGDGRVDVSGATYGWLQASNAPRWQLMPAGSAVEGFLNDELADTNDHHDYGTNWLADALRAAAADYGKTYLNTHSNAAILTVNDVSLPHGGDTPQHAGHETGLACDLKLPRTDGHAGKITHNDRLYDRASARAIIQSLRRQPLVDRVFFNDPTLIGEGICARVDGHDNHIHFQIKPPARGTVAVTLGQGSEEPAVTAAALTEAAVQMAGGHGSLLRPEYVRQQLEQRESKRELKTAFDQALQGGGSLTERTRSVVREIESSFILDPNTSSLDLLPPAQRDHYRHFAWNENDYPGKPAGLNEERAKQMNADLGRIRPERRANQGGPAVITKPQLTAWGQIAGNDINTFWQYVRDEMRTVPGQSPHKLNRHALESFRRMCVAAQADGVTLTIRDSDRSPEVSQKAAARKDNRFSIADFSSHNLGLAVDFRISHGSQHYIETTTRPMQNVVDMRQSPVHKWLFVRGTEFDWYPFQFEPWHWEYNPLGFRATFFTNWYGTVPGSTTQALTLAARSVSVQYDVPLEPQPDKLSCWAGAMSMLVSFRQQRSMTSEALAQSIGRSLRTSYRWDMLESVKDSFGFREILIPDNVSYVPPPEDWYAWLRQYGPLWVTVRGLPSHAIVVRGLHGDLTPDGTAVDILDPWDTTQRFDGDPIDFHPPNFGRRADALPFTRFAAEFINISEFANVGNWRVLYLPPSS